MAICPTYTIDSNITELYIAEEECPGQLPVTPTWYQQEPNSYSDFGGEVGTMRRETIDPSRQNQKGSAVTIEAAGGFNTDITKSNATRFLQGFFFADAREAPSNAPLNGTSFDITEVVISGLGAVYRSPTVSAFDSFKDRDLVLRSGFSNSLNNGLIVLENGTITGPPFAEFRGPIGAGFGANENPVPAGAKMDVVGIHFDSGDIDLNVVSDVVSLSSTTYDFTSNPNLVPGSWLYIGGDAALNRFANNGGFGRILSVSTNNLIFDEVDWDSPVTESGAGKEIQVFLGTFLRNEKDPSLIKRRTYQLERQLGLSSEGNVQAEYIEGSIPNEISITIPTADKVMSDLSYLGNIDSERSGLGAELLKTGNRVESPKEDALNTSTGVYRVHMGISNETSKSQEIFEFVTDASFSINNNVTQHQAVGRLGALESTPGTFNVNGSVDSYFINVFGKRAVRTLEDVTMDIILAQNNIGIIIDIPRVTLSSGRINVEKDVPIKLPIEAEGSENKFGYTCSYSQFKYLPDVAMPVVS